MSDKSSKITAISPDQAAKILSSAFGRRITPEQVLDVVESGELAHADGTFNLIEYTAYLAREAVNGSAD